MNGGINTSILSHAALDYVLCIACKYAWKGPWNVSHTAHISLIVTPTWSDYHLEQEQSSAQVIIISECVGTELLLSGDCEARMGRFSFPTTAKKSRWLLMYGSSSPCITRELLATSSTVQPMKPMLHRTSWEHLATISQCVGLWAHVIAD